MMLFPAMQFTGDDAVTSINAAVGIVEAARVTKRRNLIAIAGPMASKCSCKSFAEIDRSKFWPGEFF